MGKIPAPLKPETTDLIITGFSTSTRDKAKDYIGREGFEFWGMNSLWQFLPEPPWSAWFEIHRYSHLEEIHKQNWPKVQAHYRELGIPLYMIDSDPDFPTSIPFPLEEVAKGHRMYFESSVAYILAFALYLKRTTNPNLKTIHMFGIDMVHDTEWGYQRPNCEYWIGMLEGAGMTVNIPKVAAMVKPSCLYGYEEEPASTAEMEKLLGRLAIRQKELQNVAQMHLQKVDQEMLKKAAHEGAAQELENTKQILIQWARGRDMKR
jgi:hypothetical protein